MANPSTSEQSQSHDAVNHPKHYTSHPSGVECITITRHMSFNIGNAIKYLWRADEKGAAIEDLKKAAWYIADEIQKRETVAATYRQNPYGFLLVERCVVGTCTPDVTTGEIAPCTKCGHPYRRNDTGTAWIDAAS